MPQILITLEQPIGRKNPAFWTMAEHLDIPSVHLSVPGGYWLVVEDDDADFLLFKRACAQSVHPALHRVASAEKAKEYLRECQILPRLIVSDVNMPRREGLELLSWAKASADFKRVPFVMLSNVDLPEYTMAAIENGAEAFKLKPARVEEFVGLVEELARLSQSKSQGPDQPGA